MKKLVPVKWQMGIIALFFMMLFILATGTDVKASEIQNPFVDVSEGAYYYEPVMWAFEEGITTGTDATHFNPGGICTRKQVVTFLWRAKGCPMPISMNNPFTDVPVGSFYEIPILWAYYEGITKGKTDNSFDPDGYCTREQIVMFIWRLEGCYLPNNLENPFADVADNSIFKHAILWAKENGITTGKTATSFEPKVYCTRAQIVAFLYRNLVGRYAESDPENGKYIPGDPAAVERLEKCKNILQNGMLEEYLSIGESDLNYANAIHVSRKATSNSSSDPVWMYVAVRFWSTNGDGSGSEADRAYKELPSLVNQIFNALAPEGGQELFDTINSLILQYGDPRSVPDLGIISESIPGLRVEVNSYDVLNIIFYPE